MRVFLLFLCYSFLGWACETVYCSIGKRKFVNRGFLNGPLCPVYGFGALAVLYFLRPVSDNIPLLFVSGMVLTSVIEYITGYLLEKLFATKWWDYSSRRFNIHGRVCLRNSLMFGALSVVAVRVIDPVIRGGIYALPATVCAVVEQARLDTQEYLRQNQEELQQKMEKAKAQTEERLRQNQQELQQKMEQSRLDLELARMELRDFLEQLHSERLERREQRRREFLSRLTPEQQQAIQKLEERMEALSRRNAILRRRLLRAFPEMRSTRYELALERMREALRKKKK